MNWGMGEWVDGNATYGLLLQSKIVWNFQWQIIICLEKVCGSEYLTQRQTRSNHIFYSALIINSHVFCQTRQSSPKLSNFSFQAQKFKYLSNLTVSYFGHFQRINVTSFSVFHTKVTVNIDPKHGSSDGKAGASRSKGPEFESRSGSYETCF